MPAGMTVPTVEIDTLADIIANCINSSGGTAGDNSNCGDLFAYSTVSGGTAPTNVVSALLSIVNNPGSEASADLVIELLTGPEVLAGSTRLTAGTAQKVVLNALSTSVMIALGKAYGPRMVDVRATNEKLRRRTVRIVRDAAGVDEVAAAAALAAAGGHAKTAIVALLADIDVAGAAVLLQRARGRVRDALVRRS